MESMDVTEKSILTVSPTNSSFKRCFHPGIGWSKIENFMSNGYQNEIINEVIHSLVNCGDNEITIDYQESIVKLFTILKNCEVKSPEITLKYIK